MPRGERQPICVEITGVSPTFSVIGDYEFEKGTGVKVAECIVLVKDAQKAQEDIRSSIFDETIVVMQYTDKNERTRQVTITDMIDLQKRTNGFDTIQVRVLLGSADIASSNISG